MIAFTRSLTLDSPGDVWIMNADGSSQRPLTSTDVIEESPDWQPIPVLNGVSEARAACGDLSLEPGGVASVIAVKVNCEKALRVAAGWDHGKTQDFRCQPTRHSMDQSAVECTKPPAWRDRDHNDQRIAFVVRDPAQPDLPTTARTAPETPNQPQAQALPEDDAPPQGEADQH